MENQQPKVTVTVPVYNTKPYLRQCLDSLVLQTLEDIEIIMVDDGSTDDSGTICDEYATRYSKFKVIHQSNGGLSVARQTGLLAAKGKYVIVCDSDDWVEPEMYQNLYEVAENSGADIVMCGFYTQYDDGRKIRSGIRFKENTGIVDNDDVLSRGAGWSFVKLIRRSLFQKTNAYYKSGINLSEDSLIIYKLLKGNPKIVQIDTPLYHYRRVFGGTSYTNSLRMEHIYQLAFTYRWLKDNYKDSKYKHIVRKRAVDLAFACLRAEDTDEMYLCKFLRYELPWNELILCLPKLKTLVVCIEKGLPLCFSKFLLRILYPLFYT